MDRLKDKVAIITGSGSGMGASAAKLFSKEGAQVVIVDLNADAGQAVADDINKDGGDAIFVQVDTGKEADLKRMADESIKAFGRVDAYWHNAGIAGAGAIQETSEEEYDLQLATHLKGGFFGFKHLMPHMVKNGGGSVLFTSSVSGLKPSPASPSYSIAKSGLNILAQCIALGHGKDNIRANTICPGPVETPLWPSFMNRNPDIVSPEELTQKFIERVPLGRLIQPDEIADAALFLCSDDAKMISGALLPVDGGLAIA